MRNRFSKFMQMKEQAEAKPNRIVPSKIKLSKNDGEFMPFNVSRGSRSNLRVLMKAFEISDQIGVGYTTIDKGRGEIEPKLKRKTIHLTGGAVRDHLAGKTPRDYNLVTDATASEIRMILKHQENNFVEVKPENKDKFQNKYKNLPEDSNRKKTFSVSRWDKAGKEMAFKVTINGEDFDLSIMSKSPKSKSYDADSFDATSALEDDAMNRDFTINSMYIPLNNSDGDNTELIDPFGGAHHIKSRDLVSVNDDFESRFNEDPSIAMRFAKMTCKYGNGEKPCKKITSVIKGNEKLKDIPKDVFKKEFNSGLEDSGIDTRKYIKLLDNLGILPLIMPQYSIDDMQPNIKGDRWLTPAYMLRNSDMDNVIDALVDNGWSKSEASDISHLINLYKWAKSSYDPSMFYDLKHTKSGLTKSKIGDWMNMNGFKEPHVKSFLDHDDSDLKPYVDTLIGKKINPSYADFLGHNPKGEDFERTKKYLSTKRFLDNI